jgi:hypothetical protein
MSEFNYVDWALDFKERSFDDKSNDVWRAVNEKYNSGGNTYGQSKMDYWTVNNGTYEDHVIVSDGQCTYWVNYTRDESGKVILSDDMRKVRQEWVFENAV